jgi:hypothetical protein
VQASWVLLLELENCKEPLIQSYSLLYRGKTPDPKRLILKLAGSRDEVRMQISYIALVQGSLTVQCALG